MDGATFVVTAAEGPYSRVSFYPFLHAAGGVSGSAAVTTSIASLDPTVTARGQSLVLTLLNTALPLAPFATTTSGTSVASAFDRLRPTATGDLAVVIRELTALDDAALGQALDATAGEVYATATVLAAFDGEAVTNVVRQELATRGASENRHDRQGPVWPLGTRFWVRSIGQDTSLASGSAHGANARLSGFVAGVDRTFASRCFAGAGAGYSTGDLTVDFLGDSADYSTPRGFGYIGVSGPRWIVYGGASVARNAYDLRRSLAFAAMFPDSLGGGPIFGGIDRKATMRLTGLATEVLADAALVSHLGRVRAPPERRASRCAVRKEFRRRVRRRRAVADVARTVNRLATGDRRHQRQPAARPLWRERVGWLSAGADRRPDHYDPAGVGLRCGRLHRRRPVIGAQRRHRRRRRDDAAEGRAVVARLRREARPRRDASGDPVGVRF